MLHGNLACLKGQVKSVGGNGQLPILVHTKKRLLGQIFTNIWIFSLNRLVSSTT